MTPYILYGDIQSGSAAVEMALAEIGAPVELRSVPLGDDAQTRSDFLRINPMGRVPVLILPDGAVLTESLAVLLTLCDRHPTAGLLPGLDDQRRANALRWMAMASGEFYPAVSREDYPERFSTDPSAAVGIREAAQAFARTFWRFVETEAAPSPFLLGATFSVADLYLAVLSRWAVPKPWFGAACPRVDALAAAVSARPRSAPAWQRHFPAG